MSNIMIPGTTTALEEREVNSEFGQVWVNGAYQQDITMMTGTVTMGRSELAVAGNDSTVYRTGRKSRTGTLNFRKADSRWEDLILGYMALSPDDRRALRAQGLESFPTVTLLLVLDDPDSWGAEVIQLNNLRFWSIPIGYSGADIIERSLDCTWDSEQLLLAIPRPGNQQGYIGTAAAHQALGYPSGKSYGGYGGNPIF